MSGMLPRPGDTCANICAFLAGAAAKIAAAVPEGSRSAGTLQNQSLPWNSIAAACICVGTALPFEVRSIFLFSSIQLFP